MEPFADTIGLGVLHLGSGMIDVIDGQEQLIIMLVGPSAIFSAAVCHDPEHGKVLFLIERQDLVIEHVSSGNRRFGGVTLGVSDLEVSI